MAKISDLKIDVGLALGNRGDILQGAPSRVTNWIKSSYIAFGMAYAFSELETSEDDQVDVSNDGELDYPDTARRINCITFYRPDGTALNPSLKDVNTIRQYNQTTPGPPAIVAFYGNKILFRPKADGLYSVKIDFWQKPQIEKDVDSTDLLIPDDWLEVVSYSAQMRGFVSLMEPERAQAIQQLLYGSTVPTTGKFVPGLVHELWTRYQAQAPKMDYGIAPRQAKRSYTSTL